MMGALTVAIVTPTYNSMRTLEEYIHGIMIQSYPHEKIHMIICDGGSTDGTIERLQRLNKESDISVSIYHNSLRTAEAGKAVGVRNTDADVVLLLDSDNILPDDCWLEKMMMPFEEEEIVASEPISFTWRKKDGIINRYCALLGMGDPLCLYLGNYDRFCAITNKWTTLPREEIDKGGYLSVRFEKIIPTIGANGFIMRTNALKDNFDGDYLFDIDVLYELFEKDSSIRIAKVKTGIVHLFCADTKTFIRKQKRRIKDYLYFSENKGRKYPWNSFGTSKVMLFCLSCVCIIPLLVQAIIGYIRTKDLSAWAYHFIACWITLWIYGWGTIGGMLGNRKMASRDGWHQ